MVNRAIGIATVKPSCPTRASDPQTEGGGFCFMRCSRPSYLLNSTYRIIAQGTNFMQRQLYFYIYASERRKHHAFICAISCCARFCSADCSVLSSPDCTFMALEMVNPSALRQAMPTTHMIRAAQG